MRFLFFWLTTNDVVNNGLYKKIYVDQIPFPEPLEEDEENKIYNLSIRMDKLYDKWLIRQEKLVEWERLETQRLKEIEKNLSPAEIKALENYLQEKPKNFFVNNRKQA